MIKTLEQLQTSAKHHLLYSVITGSQAYGTATKDSDTDIKGIFALPQSAYLSIVPPQKQVSDERNDTVFYSLYRMMQLLADANPNVLELLFMPKSCVQFQSEVMTPLLAKRHDFVYLKGVEAHVGYARAQVKKAKGKNKWINNPQPEKIPGIEQFCWVISDSGKMSNQKPPARPESLMLATINLSHYHCASVEHVPNLYRLYEVGTKAKGVLRGGKIVCESIPKEDELTCYRGLLFCNVTAWQQAKRDHAHYWTWRKNRNKNRWKQQEKGLIDYDAKNMMHTIRLLKSAENMLLHGEPIIRFEGESRSQLMDIRRGVFSYAELLSMSERLVKRCDQLLQASTLSERVNAKVINRLLLEMTEEWGCAHDEKGL